MLIRDIMTRDPVCVSEETKAREAIELLDSMDIRHLPVKNDGELKGIISDRDLRSLSVAEIANSIQTRGKINLAAILDQPVSNFMSADVQTVGPEADISEAIDIMLYFRIGAVPVVDNGKDLVGIVSYIDILRGKTSD